MANAQYAVKKLNEVPGVKANAFGSAFFSKSSLLTSTAQESTVADINKALLEKGIFGGKDLSAEFAKPGPVCTLLCN